MEGYKKGLWTEEEDKILMDYVKIHGKGHWNSISKRTGLNRCGKSCRLRWMNYLNPGIKRGHFSEEEQDLIIRLHRLLGNRWSLIAGRVPGRTDNQVKNYWNSHLSKKLNPTTTGPTNINIVVVGGDAPEANNKSGICEFDETSSAHSRQSLACSGSASDAAPMPLDTDARHHHPPPPAAAASQSQEGYPTNSCFWVSEFDGLMDLVTGSGTADSFHLDWDHL